MKMHIEQWMDPKLLRILVQGSLVRLLNRVEMLNAMARTCTTAKRGPGLDKAYDSTVGMLQKFPVLLDTLVFGSRGLVGLITVNQTSGSAN